METHARRSSLVGPVILIGAGLLFLLNNLGLLSWDVWPVILRLWPVLLVGIGLELVIGHRSLVGSLLIVIILLGTLLVAAWPFVGRGVVRAGVNTEEIVQVLDGAQRADVEINAGAGDLRLVSLPVDQDGRSERLIEGQVVLPAQVHITQSTQKEGDTLYYALRGEGIETWVPWRAGQSTWKGLRWDLQLNREVPMKLQLNTGVGRAVVDLSRMNLTSLRVAAGVGEITLTVPRQGSLDARIETGVGGFTLIVPQGMAARITVHRGLGDVDVEGDYSRAGDTYTSPGYAIAANRLELDVHCGIGELIIR
jgi:hypothetical protein